MSNYLQEMFDCCDVQPVRGQVEGREVSGWSLCEDHSQLLQVRVVKLAAREGQRLDNASLSQAPDQLVNLATPEMVFVYKCLQICLRHLVKVDIGYHVLSKDVHSLSLL